MNTIKASCISRARAAHTPWTAIAVLLFCLGLTAQSALGQATLTGTVSNAATGRTLEGASVVIKGTGREAVTDKQGTYRFDNVAPGSVILSASYTGLSSTDVPVVVAAGSPNRHDIGLTADIYMLSKFVVSGEREGHAQAITLQRLSAGVKSIASTEAFGSVAGNPAELLARLPGVEAVYTGVNIRYVRIRGLNQNLTTVTMDGNRLADAASAGSSREFQFQTISSDAIERMEVVKSPTPDMDGDSIGGAVNMVSKSAFDNSGERRIKLTAGVTGRPIDPRPTRLPRSFALAYSEVFGGKLAIALNISDRSIYTLSDFTSQAYEQLPAGVAGPAYRYLVGLTDYREETSGRGETSRQGSGIRFDYKLSDNSRFFLNATLNKAIEHEGDRYVTWSTNQAVATRDASGNLTGPNGITPGYTEDFTAVRAVPNSIVTLQSTSPYKDSKTMYIQFGGVHRYNNWNIDYNIYKSDSKTNYAGNRNLSITARGIGFTIQKGSDPFLPIVTQTAGPDWTQLASYTENSYTISRTTGWDGYRGASLNLKKQFDAPVPTYIKTGVRLRNQTRRLAADPWTGIYVGPDGVMGVNPATGINDDNLAQFGTLERGRMYSGKGYYPNVPNPAFSARTNDVIDTVLKNSPQYFVRNTAANLQSNLTGNQKFAEDITAYYLMGNIDLGKLSILGGFRVESTKVDAEGALQAISAGERARRAAYVGVITDAETIRRNLAEFGGRQTRDGENRFLLPGLHFKYSPTQKLVARLSYATNIGRPSIGQLIPRTNVNYDSNTVSSSNPSLKPQTANNFDLSAEYYFEPAGVISAGVFLKELKQFIYTAGGTTIAPGQDNGFDGDYAGFIYTTQYNGGYAKVKGFEVNYNQQFTFLPGIWSGLGAFANLTKLNAEGNYGNGNAIALAPTPKIAGFNPLTGNVGVSYIRNKITLRVQATYSGRYLVGYNVNESRLVYFRTRTRVDIKTLYQLSRRFEFYLDVTNALVPAGYGRQDTGGRPSSLDLTTPLFGAGINARL